MCITRFPELPISQLVSEVNYICTYIQLLRRGRIGIRFSMAFPRKGGSPKNTLLIGSPTTVTMKSECPGEATSMQGRQNPPVFPLVVRAFRGERDRHVRLERRKLMSIGAACQLVWCTMRGARHAI